MDVGVKGEEEGGIPHRNRESLMKLTPTPSFLLYAYTSPSYPSTSPTMMMLKHLCNFEGFHAFVSFSQHLFHSRMSPIPTSAIFLISERRRHQDPQNSLVNRWRTGEREKGSMVETGGRSSVVSDDNKAAN